MSIFRPNRALIGQVQELTSRTERLQDELKKETIRNKEIQELLVDDILSLKEETATYVGNDYRAYDIAVQSLNDKYTGKDKWGCLQTRTVIDLRAAFILGEGIKVSHTTETRKEAERELQFIEDFRKYNDLDGELDQEMAKEAEIEGKIAIRIIPDKEPYRDWQGMISARFISWMSKKYKVIPDPQDYLLYKKLEWNASATAPAGSANENEFVYAKFGGRINDPNDAQPKVMLCLTIIDRLDKALRDLREIDHLFASPTPYFKCTDKAQVQAIQDYIEKTNWKIGKSLMGMADFTIVGAPIAGAEILIKEIELCVKMISGVTGIPIHYLGLLDLLKNRATGENTRELIMATTTRERQTWIGIYEEMFEKAMEMWNATFAAQKSSAAKLDPTKIKVDIPQITQEHWDRISQVLIPAQRDGIISKEFVASQIPGIDEEIEAERREERAKQEAESARQDALAMADRFKDTGGNE